MKYKCGDRIKINNSTTIGTVLSYDLRDITIQWDCYIYTSTYNARVLEVNTDLYYAPKLRRKHV